MAWKWVRRSILPFCVSITVLISSFHYHPSKLKVLTPCEENVANERKYNKIWSWADSLISGTEIYPEAPEIDRVLDALSHARIVNVDFLDIGDYETGESWKWLATLEGGQKALIKLVWEEKGAMKKGRHCYWGFEMPWAEIAAFHLLRLLGFRNSPYVTGRKINLKDEILPVASPPISRQIEVTGNQTCVTGRCGKGFICRRPYKMCPPGGTVEASVSYWIPRRLRTWTSAHDHLPFAIEKVDKWGVFGLNNKSYCEGIPFVKPYSDRKYFLDLMDFAVVDYLMYHYDRKHYFIAGSSPTKGLTILIDHGRAFCAHDKDEERLLAAIYQCCNLRRSTWEKIKSFKSGELSRKWRQSMTSDPIAPVMQDDWFPAIERRLATIIRVVGQCFDANNNEGNVLQN